MPLSASMRRLGPRLLDALTAGPGLFLVIGEAGLGKSAFLARIAAELRETSRPVIVPPAPGFAADSLLQSLTSALGIPVPVAKKAAWLRALHAALDRDGTPAPILLVDDADLLREEALLVLVAPLEATQGSAAGIRLVLCGRPVLRDRIERPALVRLRRHMRFAGELEPYGEADLRPLLIGLRPGGAVPPPAPSREVVARVLAYSAGRPAAARFLWTRALALAEEDGEWSPRLPHLDEAARLLRPRETAVAPWTAEKAESDSPIHAVASARWRSVRGWATGAAAGVLLVALWIAALTGPPRLGADADRVAASAPTALAARAPLIRPPPEMTARLEPPKPSAPPEPRRSAASAPEPAPPRAPQTAALAPPPRAAASPAVPPTAEASAADRPIRAPATRHAATPAKRTKTRGAPAAVARLEPPPILPQRKPIHLASAPPRAEAPAEEQPRRSAEAQPSCRPYVSFVNFAGRAANVRGIACRDPAGQWWVMNQQQEATP
ncbi:MAG TPA: ATP-binding protein [Stellaceae bacterium]|nr:ATP-binding protein [Stellaceae bacterium]